MTGRKRRRKTAGKSARHHKTPPRVVRSDPFLHDFVKCTPEVRKSVIDTLKMIGRAGGFTPGQRPQFLYTINKRRIWYLRAGGDIRVTYTYGDDGSLVLLTIEDHDSMKRHKSRLRSIILRLED